ncbi:MAG TPA: hypothetical protein PLB91_16395, partial [Spirochaetales bacterium]|nr:hypothetical protein [Spirochaetales bacterium]
MSPRIGRSALIGALALALGACDSFSLLEQFTLPGAGGGTGTEPLVLGLDSESTTRGGGSIGLEPSGGTKPYSFELSGYDLYAGTSSEGLGSVDAGSYIYSSGLAIGRIRISLSDAEGLSATAYVDVLPPAPTVTGATRTGSGNTISLAWAYADTSIIDRFRLDYSLDGSAFATWAYPAKSASSLSGNDFSTTGTYTIRLYAESGSFDSPPYEVEL